MSYSVVNVHSLLDLSLCQKPKQRTPFTLSHWRVDQIRLQPPKKEAVVRWTGSFRDSLFSWLWPWGLNCLGPNSREELKTSSVQDISLSLGVLRDKHKPPIMLRICGSSCSWASELTKNTLFLERFVAVDIQMQYTWTACQKYICMIRDFYLNNCLLLLAVTDLLDIFFLCVKMKAKVLLGLSEIGFFVFFKLSQVLKSAL